MTKLRRILLLSALSIFVSCTGKKKGDEFRVNLNTSATLKDPLYNLDQERLKVLSLAFEPLLTYSGNENEIKPILLSELPTLSADQLTYTFKLKSGIVFHASGKLEKGRTVASRDAVMSLLRGILEANASNYGSLIVGLVDGLANWSSAESGDWFGKKLPAGIQIKDEQEFSIRLLRKYPDFLALLTLPAFAILPSELIKDGKLAEAIGTGPYKFVSADPESKDWDLEAVGTAKFSKVRVTQSVDVKDVKASDYSSVNMKVAADLIDPVTKTLRNLPDHELKEFGLRRLELFVFNMRDPFVKSTSREFRRAVFSVLDAKAILENMYRAFALPSAQLIPPGVEGSFENPALMPMDAEEAAKVIKKTLGKKKLKIQIPQTAAYSVTDMQSNLEKVGPFFEIEVIDPNTYLDRIEKREFQLAPISWEGDLPEATNFLQIYYNGNNKNAQNLSGFNNANFDRAFDRLSKLFPSRERRKLAEEAHGMVMIELPAIPLGFKMEYAIVSKRAAGINTKSFGASALKDFLLAP